MIFVTVGEQLPFDRLITAVDGCALSWDNDVFAQIGKTSFQPQNVSYAHFLDPLEFNKRFIDADLVIGHAGMGTIITALELTTPVIIMPRLASLGEHRNDHQLATSERFATLNNVTVVADALGLRDAVLDFYKGGAIAACIKSQEPDQSLMEVIRAFIK